MGSGRYSANSYRPQKKRFLPSERYAVWSHHQKRCWFCEEPLRLGDVTIDHVLPESLLWNSAERARVLTDYGLPPEFDINGFENWLPAHARCNQKRGSTVLPFVPQMKVILDRLIRLSPEVARTASAIRANAAKDELIGRIMVALEEKAMSVEDLRVLLGDLTGELGDSASRRMIRLDNGYWLREDDIAKDETCRCERDTCVDSDTKVRCLFSTSLSGWVIRKGLYWKCYDEVIPCHRCQRLHKRGHIGREGVCGKPYRDQIGQLD